MDDERIERIWNFFLKNKKECLRYITCIFLYLFVASAIFTFISCPSYKKQPQLIKVSVTGDVSELIFPTLDGKPGKYSIIFGKDVAKLADVGKVITSGISISPRVKGTWEWISGNNILFTVEKDWPIGTSYHIQLKKELFSEHVHLETYNLKFQTPYLEVGMKKSFFLSGSQKKGR